MNVLKSLSIIFQNSIKYGFKYKLTKQEISPLTYTLTLIQIVSNEEKSWLLNEESVPRELENILTWMNINNPLTRAIPCKCETYALLRNGCKCGAIIPYEFKINY